MYMYVIVVFAVFIGVSPELRDEGAWFAVYQIPRIKLALIVAFFVHETLVLAVSG